ncbi:hypothetical protein ACOME3_005825 [Neoechinorhynchus agilis]
MPAQTRQSSKLKENTKRCTRAPGGAAVKSIKSVVPSASIPYRAAAAAVKRVAAASSCTAKAVKLSQQQQQPRESRVLRPLNAQWLNERRTVRREISSVGGNKRHSQVFPVKYADEKDDFECRAYAFRVYEYLRDLEDRHRAVETHPDKYVCAKSRSFVINWLISKCFLLGIWVNIHRRFHMKQETLQLSIRYFDKYIENVQYSHGEVQLIALTSLFIASKYEETYIPTLDDFLFLTDGSYEVQRMLDFEQRFLTILNYELGLPSPINFLKRASKISGVNHATYLFALYLIELWFFDLELVRQWSPSHVASVALYVSMVGHNVVPVWSPAVAFHMKVSEDQVEQDSRRLCSLIDKVDQLGCSAVCEKYTIALMNYVATNTYIATFVLRSNGYLRPSVCSGRENRENIGIPDYFSRGSRKN